MTQGGDDNHDEFVDQDAVLGRYGVAPGGAADQVQVRLLHFPLQVFRASRDRHDELMREFALLAIRPAEGEHARGVPHRMLELVEILGRRYGAAENRSDWHRDEALERGELAMDLVYTVPASIGDAMRTLHALMREADAFCLSEQLLTLAPSPLDVEFRTWFCQQFIDQVAGEQPVAWDGPLEPDL